MCNSCNNGEVTVNGIVYVHENIGGRDCLVPKPVPKVVLNVNDVLHYVSNNQYGLILKENNKFVIREIRSSSHNWWDLRANSLEELARDSYLKTRLKDGSIVNLGNICVLKIVGG